MSDIYGANLYNRYLQSIHHSRTRGKAKAGSTGQVAVDVECKVIDDAKNSGQVFIGDSYAHCLPESCTSILVCTGVYNREKSDLSSDQRVTGQDIFHGHRDFHFDPALIQPSFVVHDVQEAVELIFQQEGWSLE